MKALVYEAMEESGKLQFEEARKITLRRSMQQAHQVQTDLIQRGCR